jgi:hypothetical protein
MNGTHRDDAARGPVEPVDRRLREAHDLLDERPRNRARANVLRAASEAAAEAARRQARPARPAGAGWWRPWSFRPLQAVAATALVGVVAALLVARVEREQGTPAAPAASGRPAGPEAPSRPAASTTVPGTAARSVTSGAESGAPRGLAPAAPLPAPPRGETGEAALTPSRRDAAPEPAASPADAGPAARPPAPAPEAPQARAVAIPAAPEPAAVQEQTDVRALGRAAPAVNAGAQRAMKAAPAHETAGPQAASPEGVSPETARPETASLAAWFDRIIALRRAGRDEEADRELARLRARFPDAVIPPAAQKKPD